MYPDLATNKKKYTRNSRGRIKRGYQISHRYNDSIQSDFQSLTRQVFGLKEKNLKRILYCHSEIWCN
ncbi:hypothetical protein BpHYR1_047536 [Brachionus plicatilis]|uniref:Uncharacterized protein n=1 Tax=Brachionus plicatilis TaxID=10195 RepID=A0A3M7QED6_BRAPC|nr:hypothetical protein BpHYR1_047536 [Brachionus plicatilis]